VSVGNLILVVVCTAAALFVAELVIRTIPGIYEPDWPIVTRFDPTLGWSLIPDISATIHDPEFVTSERINSFGLRGPELPEHKESGELRVLLLGDSFVEGYTVDQGQTVDAVLERTIDDPRVRVINAGTRGWSTDQELPCFTENAAVLAPDLTILLFYINDVCMNATDRYWRGNKPRYVLHDDEITLVPVAPSELATTQEADVSLRRMIGAAIRGSAIAQVSRKAINRFWGQKGQRPLPKQRIPWSKSVDAYPCLEEGWEVTDRLITTLREEVESRGGEFVVFWVPTKEAIYREDWERVRKAYDLDPERFSTTADAERLHEICQRRDLDCVIPLEEFQQAARSSDQRLYFVNDPHWTPAGHELAGRILADVVRGYLGSRQADPPEGALH